MLVSVVFYAVPDISQVRTNPECFEKFTMKRYVYLVIFVVEHKVEWIEKVVFDDVQKARDYLLSKGLVFDGNYYRPGSENSIKVFYDFAYIKQMEVE